MPARAQVPTATETLVPLDRGALFARAIGRGPAVMVLHGGPDFDQAYLVPEMDLFSNQFRLIYYDQRGRGKSADGVRPDEVTLASDIEDLDRVRQYFQLDSTILLGHSWGSVLALEYALRHPDRVSRLILMNPAPASASQLARLRAAYVAQLGPAEMERQSAARATTSYKEGNPDTVAARYRIHFKHALHRPAHYEMLMTRMSDGFRAQGAAGILKAWAIEDRLYRDTWQTPGYDLLPKLAGLRIPTLVIVGARDFIPPEIAAEIAKAIPNAKLVTIKKCGHFAYLECPDEVRRAFAGVLVTTTGAAATRRAGR